MGQSANVTLDAIPNASYSGKVTEVGQVGSVSSGVVYFKVTVLLDKPDATVRPSMTATASIEVGQEDNVLLVPNRSIRTENGAHVVYVPAPQIGLRPVTVQVGDSDETMTVITGGLKEGEGFITDPPSTSTINPAQIRGIFGVRPGGNGGEDQPPAPPPFSPAFPP